MKNKILFLLIATCGFIFSGCVDDLFTPDTGVKYRVKFQGNWTEDNFPTDFPSNDHFSDFIGLTHNENISLFEEGDMATEGIQVMAETGETTPLDQEVFDLVTSDDGFDFIIKGGVRRGKGDKTFDIFLDEDHTLVSIVSMIAPSPDWFIAVKDVDLWNNGSWINSLTVNVTAWDAGTDSGTTYTSGNVETNPQETIELLTAPPVGGSSVPLGTFTFELRD